MSSAIMSSMISTATKRPSPGMSMPSECSSTLPASIKRKDSYAKRQRTIEVSPTIVLRSIFGSDGLKNHGALTQSFSKPSEEEISAYDMDAVRAIRSGDLMKLKHLHAQGKNLNASNQFGESLLHMACRRGNVDIVSYMLREANVRVDIRDDFGRTPIHDACWTSSPNFQVMDELLEFVNPSMLLSEDVRGSSPFDYVRRNHWDDWVKYLADRKAKIQKSIETAQQTRKEASSS